MLLWEEVVSSFFTARHLLLSSECFERDPMLMSRQIFVRILNSAGILSEGHRRVFSNLCFASRAVSSQFILRWGHDGIDSSRNVHFSYILLVLFSSAINEDMSANHVYNLTTLIFQELLELVHLGGNRLVASVFLEALDCVLAFNRMSMVGAQNNDFIVVSEVACRECHLSFFVASSCFNESNCLSIFWNALELQRVGERVAFKIRTAIDMASGKDSIVAFLVACLDFFMCQIMTTFTVCPVILATRLMRRALPCSLIEISLTDVEANDSRLNDPSVLKFSYFIKAIVCGFKNG